MKHEQKLKEILDDSIFDRSKPVVPTKYGAEDIKDDLLIKQMKMPVEKVQEILNIRAVGDRVFVEPARRIEETASGLSIPLPANKQDIGMIMDMSLFTCRVITISDESTKKTGIVAGDIVILGQEQTPTYRLYGIQISETRLYNIVAVIKDKEFHESYKWWEGGKVDVEVKSIEALHEIRNTFVGMKARVVEGVSRKIFYFEDKKGWKLDKKVTYPGSGKMKVDKK